MSTSRPCRLDMYLSAVTLSALTTFASAQTSNNVLLEAFDKSVVLSGELIEASDGQYKLSTSSAGVLSIDVNAVNCTGDACPPLVPIFEAGAEAKLISTDGAVNIVGNITDIVDGHYVVDNAVLGSLRINKDLVDCSGPGCPTGLRFADQSSVIAVAVAAPATAPTPATKVKSATAVKANAAIKVESNTTPKSKTEQLDPANASVSFAGSDTVGLGLLPYLLDDYADYLNATAETKVMSETETLVRYVGTDESELSSIYVNATGSGEATDALATKTALLGMTSRQINDDEAQRLITAGAGDLRNSDNETVIAVDSLAVITHSSNPVTELSMEELGGIYLGQIDNWSQVGGPNAPITVLSRDDGSSTRSVFENAVFNGEEPPLAEQVVYPGGDNPEMAAAVKDNPLAIGYVGFAYSEGLNRLDLTSECGITSTATPFSVKTEEYPLGRRLYLYNRADNTPTEVERFLKYVLSPDADDAIAQSSFVNFAVERNPHSPSRFDKLYEGRIDQSEVSLANLMNDDMQQWDRFSTTIRFRTSSSRLGNKELNDIERLISTLSELPNGTRIAAVGFTDDVGPFDRNLRLSERRAQTVADAIASIAGDRASNVEIETRSYSELSPSVCNSDDNGRAINRRVEIWVKK